MPYCIRVKQCSVDLYKSSCKLQKTVHLLNSIKYVVLLVAHYVINVSNFGIYGFSFVVMAICFATYWDMFMDWGIHSRNLKSSIRPTILIVCILNMFLRLLSIPKLISYSTITDNLFLICGLEILRRSVWTHFRVLNYLKQQEV